MVICSICQLSVDRYAHGRKCRNCYNAYMREYMKQRYHAQRAQTIEQLGGACVDCGATGNLEFDHQRREGKVWSVGQAWSRSVIADEIAKCVLRCTPCHRTKTSREMSVGHGGGVAGKRNCKCEPCRSRKREYMRGRNH